MANISRREYFILYTDNKFCKEWTSTNYTLAEARKHAKSIVRDGIANSATVRRCFVPSFSEVYSK